MSSIPRPPSISSRFGPRHVAGTVAGAVALDTTATRNRVLAEVARLGLELLSPEEPPL